MQTTNSLRRFIAGISFVGAVLLTSGFAAARPEAPGELQDAAGMKCVPLCTMCHQTNPGNATNWTKLLGRTLYGDIKAERDIKASYASWAQTNPQGAERVKNGQEPETGVDVCGPTYGCAVRIEKEAAAPRDFGGPLFVVGAVVLGGLLRRRRKTAH